MANLDALKFAIAIKDQSVEQLERVEQTLSKLKDTYTVNINFGNNADLDKLLALLTKASGTNLGKDLSVSIGTLVNQMAKLLEEGVKLKQSAQDALPTEQIKRYEATITSLKTQVQTLTSEMEKMKTSGGGMPSGASSEIVNAFSTLLGVIEKLEVEVNKMVESFTKLNGAMHLDKTKEEIAEWEERIAKLKNAYGELANKIENVDKTEATSAAESKGSVSAKLANLDKLNTALTNVEAALAQVEGKYDLAQSLGLNDPSIDNKVKKLRDLRSTILELMKDTNPLLDKRGGIGEMLFGDMPVLGQTNKALYSTKAIKELSGELDTMLAKLEQQKRIEEAQNNAPKIESEAELLKRKADAEEALNQAMQQTIQLQEKINQGAAMGADTTWATRFKGIFDERANGMMSQIRDFKYDGIDKDTMTQQWEVLENGAKRYLGIIDSVIQRQQAMNEQQAAVNAIRKREAEVLVSRLEERLHDYEHGERTVGSDPKLTKSIEAAKEYLEIMRQIVAADGNWTGKQPWEATKESAFRILGSDARDAIKEMQRAKDVYAELGLRKDDPGLQNIQNAMDNILTKLSKVREDIELAKASINAGSKEGIPFINETVQLLQNEANTLMRQYTALAEAKQRLLAGGQEQPLFSTERSNKELELLNESFRNGTSELQKMAAAETAAADASKIRLTNLQRVQNTLQSVNSTIERFGTVNEDGYGFNTATLERYKAKLLEIRDALQAIEGNNGVHPLSGLTASQYLKQESVSGVLSGANNELALYKQISSEFEKIEKLKEKLEATLKDNPNSAFAKDLKGLADDLRDVMGLVAKSGAQEGLTLLKNFSVLTEEYRNLLAKIPETLSNVKKEQQEEARVAREAIQMKVQAAKQAAKEQAQAEKEAANAVKQEAKAEEERQNSVERSGIAVSNLEKILDRFRTSKTLGKANALGVDTSELNGAIQRVERLQKILQYIRDTGGVHDASRITGSAGYHEAINNLYIFLRRLRQMVNETGAATNQLTNSERQLAQALKSTNAEAKNQGNILNDLKSLVTQYLGVWGGQQFLQNIIQIGGQLESQRLSLTAILGQASYANDLFAKVQDLALKSPFGVVQIDQYTKQLAAFGFEYNELFDMTSRLADIAAGTGTDFGRLALALGHVRSEMALSGYTLRQFSMANVPMLKMLAENLGVTTAEIRKMVREKKISDEDVVNVLKQLTDEGGMFYHMQETMSEAVSAKFKNLKDSMDIMYGQMAESVVGDMLKGIASTLMEVTKRWQAFGTVIATSAAFIGAYKLGLLAVNAGLKSFSANALMSRVSTASMTAEQVKHLAVTNQITAEDLIQAVATKKLTLAQAELAREYFVLDASILKTAGSMNRYKLAMEGVKNSSMAAALANPWTIALIAIEAVVGAIMAYNSWSDKIQGSITNYLERQKTAAQEAAKYLKEAKKEGKPTDERDLLGEIEQMKTILKNSEMYTEELEQQVGLTPTLSDEYDVLIKKMESANSVLDKMGASAETLADAVKATSTNLEGWQDFLSLTSATSAIGLWNQGKDWVESVRNSDGFWDGVRIFFSRQIGRTGNLWNFFFNEDINKNVADLQKSIDSLSRKMAGLDKYRDKMQSAIDMMIKTGDHVEMANYPLEEQIRILAEDEDAWDVFVELAGRGSKDFEEHANNVREAAKQVTDDWEEITTDDVPRMIEELKDMYNTDEAGLLRMYQNNERNFRDMLDGILFDAKEKSPQIYAALMAMLPSFLRGEQEKKGWLTPHLWKKTETPAQKKAKEEAEKNKKNNEAMKKMGQLSSYLPKIQALAPTMTVEELSKWLDINKDAEEMEKAVVAEYKKQKNLEEKERKMGRSAYADAAGVKARETKAIMDVFGWKEDSKKSSGSKGEDEEAKRLRERVRILKEAADAYQYWREKVGEKGAEAHMNEEFGNLLKEQGFNLENVEQLRQTFQSLYAKYDKAPNKSKAMLEALKEIDKELAQLDRKDFEKATEDFLSKTQIELDNLTRAWDEFNQVLEATGDIDLARNLSGANYIEGTIRTSADAVKAMLKRDYRNAGGSIESLSFNPYLSDKKIEKEVYDGAPRAEGETLAQYEERIKALVESYKKWRDQQREVHTKDLQALTQILGNAQDYESQIKKIDEELREQKESINAVAEASGKEKAEAIAMANAIADDKKFKISATYLNLMNNAAALTTKELKSSAQAAEKNLANSLKNGVIAAKEYADEMERIHQIVRDINLNSFWGKGAFGAFVKGGVNGAVSWYDKAINARITKLKEKGEYTTDANGEYNGNDEELKTWVKNRKSWEKVQKSLNGVSEVTQLVSGAFEGLQQATQSLSEMFEALGNQGAANFWSDVSDTIGGISAIISPLNNLVGNAMSGNISGIAASAISAPIQMVTGPVLAFAKLHDKKRERQIEALRQDVQNIGNTLNTIKSLRERSLGYDQGNIRRQLYESAIKRGGENAMQLLGGVSVMRAADRGMIEYYGRGGLQGSGYKQEYEGLKRQREDYMKMYNAEAGKKHSSAAAMEEYKAQIAELDEQILHFSQDLANELWGIDIKGWANQISDALMTAFENGKDGAEAFEETVQDIMQSVASNIIKIGLLEPMMEKLRNKLFGSLDENGNMTGGVVSTEDIVDNPEEAASKIFKATSNFFDAEGSAMIEASKVFYDKMNALAGGKLDELNEESSLSGGIKSISEETADLLASYLNAVRADVAILRDMQNTYFEDVRRHLTTGNIHLVAISQNTRAIMQSSERIAQYTESMEGMFRGLKNNTWRLPV